MKKSGILASVSLAQFILESGYGKSELAQNANNCFGMKKSLSGNTWAGSSWDGKSVYTKKTQEDDGTGKLYTITADFRKYPCVEDSIADHSAYLLGAMNGSKQRYAGLKGCTDYKKAVQIIKDGGYATSTTYVTNLCNIIERWNLTQYDVKEASGQKQEASVVKLTDRVIHDITTRSSLLWCITSVSRMQITRTCMAADTAVITISNAMALSIRLLIRRRLWFGIAAVACRAAEATAFTRSVPTSIPSELNAESAIPTLL